MTPLEQLISLGIRPACAADTVRWYTVRRDEAGLQRYIENIRKRRTEESDR